MKKLIINACLFGCMILQSAGSNLFAQTKNPVAISDQYPDPSNVKLNGLLGAAIQSSEKGRLSSLPLWHNAELFTMFSKVARDSNKTTDWYGEHAGKWLYATSMAVNRTGDPQLKSLLVKTADYLMAQQAADGYLGSYSPALRITNDASTRHQKSWDTWTLSYMTLGFLNVYRYFPEPKYLDAAKKIGELLLTNFSDGKRLVTSYGTRYGISATIVLDPVVELYRVTNDPRYLDFAELIVKEMEEREGLRLISAALHNRDLETVADGKAYQVIWNLLGIIKLYEATGNKDYLHATLNAWQNIYDYHLTVAGGPWGGVGKHKECFNDKGYWSPYGFIETCSTMSWIQLNKELLQITGEAKYAQEIEKSGYNALLGAQFPDGLNWSYHSFSNGRKHVAHTNDCCPSSGALALEELSPVAFSMRENGIAVNLYAAAQATLKLSKTNVQITETGGYPFNGHIEIAIKSLEEARFPLFLRIPDWVDNPVVLIDGQPTTESPTPGTYLRIERKWNSKSKISIDFPISMRTVEKDLFATVPQGENDIFRVKWMAFQRGPLVYAASGLIDDRDRERNLDFNLAKVAAELKSTKEINDQNGPEYLLETKNSKPLLLKPYYRADGRKEDHWRLTWLQFSID